MGSELWFREFERILTEKEEAIDAGTMNPRVRAAMKAKAYDEAGEEAGPALAERLADMADMERKRRREDAALRDLVAKLDPSVDNIDPEGNEQ